MNSLFCPETIWASAVAGARRVLFFVIVFEPPEKMRSTGAELAVKDKYTYRIRHYTVDYRHDEYLCDSSKRGICTMTRSPPYIMESSSTASRGSDRKR